MIQVLLYHAWHIGSPIGVDAFIMISAYLLTNSIVKRNEKGKRQSILNRWAQLFKRLLPPLVVTVILTVAFSIAFLPPIRWPQIIKEAFASILYFQNWLLAWQSVDYYAVDSSRISPLLHLWSMSMQGQVFILWPLILILLGRFCQRKQLNHRLVAAITMGGIFALSFTWMMINRYPQPANIYFDTRSRLWEFALGSLIAILTPRLKLSPILRVVATWLGLGTLILFSLVSIGRYPGHAALFPMLATASILAGTSEIPSRSGNRTITKYSVKRFLSIRPLVALGDISYALYLIHWPIMAIYLGTTNKEHLSLTEGITILVISVALALLTTNTLDTPLRYWSWANANLRNKVIVVVVSLATGLLGVFGLNQVTERKLSDLNAQSEGLKNHPGAQAIYDGIVAGEISEPPIPTPLQVAEGKKWFSLPDKCAGFGPTYSGIQDQCFMLPFDPSRPTVMLVGSSHTQQFAPAVIQALKNHNKNVILAYKGGCKYEPVKGTEEEYCQVWQKEVHQFILRIKPEAVITKSTATRSGEVEVARDSFYPYAKDLTDHGIKLIGFRDTPRFPYNMYDCSNSWDPQNKDHPVPIGGCFVERSKIYADQIPLGKLAELPNFKSLDLSDLQCPGKICPGIIGNSFVYFDEQHLTIHYAESMGKIAQERLEQIAPDIFPKN
ncbi:hypothetical protein BK816_03105 [Boudabousia tangfeifanii]|uniref:Acyltransferase n=2 Tax=Boudabousia tangfeifanii TaxID=1912795 RepID=A0A1D9MJE3_9ACTO|nr:hypothetical protein BK816_03105 [Boudabousia tangfeifanii]